MASRQANFPSRVQSIESNDPTFIGNENGFVNAIKFHAKPGAKAYRNYVVITVVSTDGRRQMCLTERKSKRDASKDLPISAHELRVNSLILDDAFTATNGFRVDEGLQRVYNSRAMMYTPCQLSNLTIELSVKDLVRSQGYITGSLVIVEIRSDDMGFLDLNDQKFYSVVASTGQEDHELRTFYELLVVQGSLDSHECVAVGSELYIACDPRRQNMYLRGISFLEGFKKNARIVQENGVAVMKLVLDPVSSAFYAEQRLADAFHDVTRGNYSNQVAIELFRSLYKNVRVYLSFNKSKILPVHGLSDRKLEDLSFDRGGTRISVIDHFAETYGFHSEAGMMPALEVRFVNGERGHYPLDCLEVLKCQKVRMSKYGLVSTNMHDDILKLNAVKAPVRFGKTSSCFSYIEKSENVFHGFGVSFSPCQMIRLGIRAKPRILTGTGTVNPDAKARFNLRGHRYVDPSSCKKWMVLNGSKQNIQQAIEKVMMEARNRGLNLARPEISIFDSTNLEQENWTELFNDLLEYGYEYVLLIDPRKTRQPQIHHMLKCCELIFGIQTQHVHHETLMKFSCHDNIVHKMNMKLDGINYNVVLEPCSISKLFYDDEIFIMGYDVAHPTSTNLDDAEPSVVGVSFNSCRQYQSFNGNYFYQSSNQESVDPELLKKATLFGLEMRRKQRPRTCSVAPKLVFCFRDGLSEGQILMAKLEELEAIKEAFQEYYSGSKLPPFVMVLATKRHNRRFYSARHENVIPGSVASQGIARLGADEFYLQSAYPIQGTAKLTDYEIISNEAKLSMNDMQAFTHGMCYGHQIVASAVSLPEPVYLAHELAKRGRNNLVCYRGVSEVPRNADATINYRLLNKRFTYLDNELVNRRFNA